MAKVIPIGQPANESERQAIGFLRDHLPDGWLIFHNFEMRQGEEVFEIDIAILAPHAVYLVDVKGTRGNIDVYGSKWYPEGRQPFFSPLAKLRRRSQQELINTEHQEYKVFMAVVDRAGVDARGNLLFQRAPDGEELVFDEEVIERVREGGEVEVRRTMRRNRRIHDELPLVAEKYKEFRATGEVTL